MTIELFALNYACLKTGISSNQVKSTLELLLLEKCTIPFVTRYRKEKTGGLNEVEIAAIENFYQECLEIEKRRSYILSTIEEMGLLTPELKVHVQKAATLSELEDLYAPFKSKKKTKGQLAIEAGLLALAETILAAKIDLAGLALLAKDFISKEKGIVSADDALEGARAIIIEKMAQDSDVKSVLRNDLWKEASMQSSFRPKAQENSDWHKYKDYAEFEQKIGELKLDKNTHRFLAMRRGMQEHILKIEVIYPEESGSAAVKKKFIPNSANAEMKLLLSHCADKAYKNYIFPSLDLEIKSELKKIADEAAIAIFGENLKNLLLSPYLGPKAVMAIDPGIRTGCKIAVVDNTGKLQFDTVIYPHAPNERVQESAKILEALILQFKVENIAIGNGTYGRETLEFVQTHVPSVKNEKCQATLTSEAGASVYSASEIARKEFPDKDPTVRGAISIARRFQDPLAELVKIDPKSIGVGQYQHDVNQTKLKKSLQNVVENCVNYVGVDLNTASAPLLSFISGIGPSIAQNIVSYREEKGTFKKRQGLLKVPLLGKKVYEQAAGFLRIYDGENPLDSTFIHPESYDIIKHWCQENSISLNSLIAGGRNADSLDQNEKDSIQKFARDNKLVQALGEFTFQDIIKSIKTPCQDPRKEFQSTAFRKGVHNLSDLVVGEWYPGVVTNITQFGAFVDIGIKENGLLHISQMADSFVSNPFEVLKVGEEVKVRILEVDHDRKRITLTRKTSEKVSASNHNGSQKNYSKKSPAATVHNAALKNNAFAALKDFKIK